MKEERRESDKIVEYQVNVAITFVPDDWRRSDPGEGGMACQAGFLIVKNHAQETAVDRRPALVAVIESRVP